MNPFAGPNAVYASLLVDLTTIARDTLEKRLEFACRWLKEAEDNLTAVQTTCTAQLEELRAFRAGSWWTCACGWHNPGDRPDCKGCGKKHDGT